MSLRHPVLRLVLGVTCMVCLGITSLIPALPLIARHFLIPPAESWKVIASFALAGLFCVPFAGILSDRLGRKALLIPALALMAGGGALCALAGSYAELLFWRMAQGAGSASLSILYASIIADTWSGEERIKAMSLCALVLGVGTALAPALGGALCLLDWRLPFLLPLFGLFLAWKALSLPLHKPSRAQSFRAYAAACLASALGKGTLPLLALTLLTFIMMSGPITTCFPLLAEGAFQASPLQSGLLLASASLTAGLCASLLPRLCARLAARPILILSMGCYMAAFLSIGLAQSLLWLLPGLLLYGFGQGLNLPLVQTLLAGQAGDSERGALMSLNAILLRLGQNVGPWAFGSLAAWGGPALAILCGVAPAACMAGIAVVSHLPRVDGKKPDSALPAPQ